MSYQIQDIQPNSTRNRNAYQGIGVSRARLFHMVQVGRTAYRLSKELFGWSEEKCQQMFILGLIHDVGYEFAFEQEDHGSAGADVLAQCGFMYSDEIRWHGVAAPPYKSDELLVLNIADLITSKNGDLISVTDKLTDICIRYGKDSPQYLDSLYLAGDITLTLGDRLKCSKLLRQYWDLM